MSKFCGLACQRNKNQDYEHVSYRKIETKRQDVSDYLDRLELPTKQSRTRLPICVKATPKRPNRSVTFNLTNNSPIESQVKSPNISTLPYLIQTPKKSTKLTSTLIATMQAEFETQTPNTSSVPYKVFDTTVFSDERFFSCDDTTLTSDDTTESSIPTMTTINNEPIEHGKCFVCFRNHDGQYDGDLTLRFAERVQVLQDNGTDHVLGKSLSSKKIGYIRRDCLLPVSEFLTNLI
jgi:hypothetical protein